MITKIENLPTELKDLRQWVCWSNGDKIPRNPHTGGNAMANTPSTWGTLEEAINACEKYKFDGVGFEFANGYFGVDLDHCLDKTDFCDEFVDILQSYAEISKSGNGLHIICKGTLPEGSRRKGNVEMYSEGRYFICTGNLYNEAYKEVQECTERVKVLYNKYLPNEKPNTPAIKQITEINLEDHEVIDKARGCKTGYVFAMLYAGQWQGVYPSQSEADLALCNQLAFWTQRKKDQMDRIFRSSGLMRKKWDEKRGANTYGEITITKACAECVDVYDPKEYPDDTKVAFAVFGGKTKIDTPKKQYDFTDTGNAHRLLDKFGDVIRYSYNRKKWYYWNGKMWRLDDTGEIKKMADIICEDIKKEAFMLQDEDAQAKLLKWATRTASSSGKEAMIKECQHLGNIPTSPDDFDACPDYLNCQNGIVNLRNGELLKHDADMMITKICYTDYDASHAKPKRWLQFLDEVTNGDKELQGYIQKSIGYSLSGSNVEQCAYFLYGMGNNGKSTFLDTLSNLLGTYASTVQPETIMMKKLGGDGANHDIARLKSARFVVSSETPESVRLNEGLLKQLTGGSKITCRFLYSEEFEYTPEFKIWVDTNHKPVIHGTDYGIWRRIKLIPFEVTIPSNKIDKNLKSKLSEEYPQILAWAVEGCIKWQKEGLEEPECVKLAVKDYKQEMDLLANFVEQCVVIDYDCEDKIMGNDLFRLYSKWARDNNEYEMSANKFGREIVKKLPDKGRGSAGAFFKHIRYTDYGSSLERATRQFRIEDFH